MLIAYTGDYRFKEIRNRILMKEMEGVKISMGTYLDELERNKIIESAKTNVELGASNEFVIKFLMKQLDVLEEEAKEIFENEVANIIVA